MKVLITGATGFVGKKLSVQLFKEGHELIILSRNKERAQNTLDIPCEVYEWDPLNEPAPQEAVDKADAIVHLLGENISNKRWSSAQKKRIYDSRIIGSRNLVESIDKRPSKLSVLCSTSAVGIYPANTNEDLTESSSYGNGFLNKVCKDWEGEVLKSNNIERTFIARVGVIFGYESGAIAKLMPIFKIGGGGPIGLGNAWMSWIHVDDLVQVYKEALTNNQFSGPANCVSPHQVLNKDFTKAFAKAVQLPALFPVPPIMLKLIFGEMSSIILDSQKVIPQKLSQWGFNYRFADINKAMEDICNKKSFEKKGVLSCEKFEKYQFLPKGKDETFNFFSNPNNLEKITPSFLNFKIKKLHAPKLQKGALIDYSLKLHGIPLGWRTLISEWEPNNKFVDIQIKGPYTMWHHTHSFIETSEGTLIHDTVLYKLPMGPLGYIFGMPFVLKDVEKIFKFRKIVIKKMLLD